MFATAAAASGATTKRALYFADSGSDDAAAAAAARTAGDEDDSSISNGSITEEEDKDDHDVAAPIQQQQEEEQNQQHHQHQQQEQSPRQPVANPQSIDNSCSCSSSSSSIEEVSTSSTTASIIDDDDDIVDDDDDDNNDSLALPLTRLVSIASKSMMGDIEVVSNSHQAGVNNNKANFLINSPGTHHEREDQESVTSSATNPTTAASPSSASVASIANNNTMTTATVKASEAAAPAAMKGTTPSICQYSSSSGVAAAALLPTPTPPAPKPLLNLRFPNVSPKSVALAQQEYQQQERNNSSTSSPSPKQTSSATKPTTATSPSSASVASITNNNTMTTATVKASAAAAPAAMKGTAATSSGDVLHLPAATHSAGRSSTDWSPGGLLNRSGSMLSAASTRSFDSMSNVSSANGGAAEQELTQQQRTVRSECDYHQNPTELYQAIEAQQWDYVIKMFEQEEGFAELSPGNPQSACWVVRKESNGKLRWRLLPLHAAVIFQAPATVVEYLLLECPSAAACKDDQGMLPLHLALRNQPINWRIVEELLTQNPNAIYTKDRKGRTPLQGGQQSARRAINKNDSKSQRAITDDNDDDSKNRAASLATLELYGKILSAGEKSRARDSTERSVRVLQEQHLARLQGLQVEFEREQERVSRAWREERRHYEDSLRSATQQILRLEEALRVQQQQYQRLDKKIEVERELQEEGDLQRQQDSSSHVKVQKELEVDWVQRNAELQKLVRVLLDQQAATSRALEQSRRDHKEHADRQEERLRQCWADDRAANDRRAAEQQTWITALDCTYVDVSERLARLP